MSDQPIKIVVMVSGNGTNLQALIDAIENKLLKAEIIQVISNRKSAYALKRAQQHHIPTSVFLLNAYKASNRTREHYDIDLAHYIRDLEPDLIVLAGWMHILSEDFLRVVRADAINLHPALPGQFAGINAIERAFEAFQTGEITHSGCMIHYVIPEVDAGRVIVQEQVPILPEDTLEVFADRMHQTERRILVESLRKIQQYHNEDISRE